MEGGRARWRCRHTAYAIRPPRPHRSVRRHAAFRLRPRAGRGISLCTSGPEAVPPPRRRSPQPRLPPHSFVLVGAGARRCTLRVPAREVSGTSTTARCCTRPPSSRRRSRFPWRLPWMSGNPYAAYARVRARTAGGVTRLDDAVRLQRRAGTPFPTAILPSQPGLARWTPVPGATSYHVWFTDIGKVVATRTNAVDEREFYAFHRAPAFTGAIHWRVRAVRTMYGTIPSSLPARHVRPVEQGEHVDEPGRRLGAAEARRPRSRTMVPRARPRAARVHRLTPAFTFSGDQVGGSSYTLFRVYVFSDSQCVNVIYRGAITGVPSYAPRTTGPLALPMSAQDLLGAAADVPSRRPGRQDVHGGHRKRADDRERQAGCRGHIRLDEVREHHEPGPRRRQPISTCRRFRR